ncbi:MAG: hypothetical protein EOO10_17680 [Chitinophagaceae bacterium]|nr:MAG: hypothetical protein EOO10_17680 [Chitinophagaceae bacterium]
MSVVFRAITDSSIRDIALSPSVNNGKSFGPSFSFSNDNWMLNGCPHNGPSVVSSENATLAAWFTGGSDEGVYYGEVDSRTKTTQKKLISASGKNIQLCLLPNGQRMMVYSEQVHAAGSVYSQIMAAKLENGKLFSQTLTTKGAHASYPVAINFGTSKMIAAWTEMERILYRVIDAGQITTEAKQPATLAVYKTKTVSGKKLSNSNDPSCGMPLPAEVKETTFANNKVIGFCSKACKEKFLTASHP